MAGSAGARSPAGRWWSVLPMHVQYFTRASLARLLRDHGFDVRAMETHAEAFSVRYYAERAATLLPVGSEGAARAAAHLPGARRLVVPDFRDRVQVVAVRA